MPIRFRPDRNKWQADVKIRGKRERPLFELKKEALEFERACRLGLNQGGDSATLDESIKDYFKDISPQKVTSNKTEKRYFNYMFHFLSERGVRYVDQVEIRDLQALQRWLLEPQKVGTEAKRKWSKATVNRCFHTLNHFFSMLVEWKRLGVSPAANLKSLSEDEPSIEVVSPEVYEGAVRAVSTWFKPCLEFIHVVGCRPSSIERLTWKDINFKDREFTLLSIKGRNSKTKRISIPMTDQVFSILIKIRNSTPGAGPDDAVFRNAHGDPLTAAWISKSGTKLFKGQIRGGAIKALRHTLASDLTSAGVPTEVVRQALGHSNIRTTQRYARSINPTVVQRAVELVRNNLAPNGTSDGEAEISGRRKGIG